LNLLLLTNVRAQQSPSTHHFLKKENTRRSGTLNQVQLFWMLCADRCHQWQHWNQSVLNC